MRKDAEYLNLNISLLLDPFITESFHRRPLNFNPSPCLRARSRINRSYNERRYGRTGGRTDGYSRICLSIRLYVYFARSNGRRARISGRKLFSLFASAAKASEGVALFDSYGNIFRVTDSISPFRTKTRSYLCVKAHSKLLSFSLSLFLSKRRYSHV